MVNFNKVLSMKDTVYENSDVTSDVEPLKGRWSWELGPPPVCVGAIFYLVPHSKPLNVDGYPHIHTDRKRDRHEETDRQTDSLK